MASFILRFSKKIVILRSDQINKIGDSLFINFYNLRNEKLLQYCSVKSLGVKFFQAGIVTQMCYRS